MGCQMVYFKTKTPNLGHFRRALELKMLVYFMVIWNTYIFYGYLIYFIALGNVVVIWLYFSLFGYIVQK
jgi:hypothetical protein